MSDMRFFGKYAICRSENKSKGAHLVGPDNIVGNEVFFDFRKAGGSVKDDTNKQAEGNAKDGEGKQAATSAKSSAEESSGTGAVVWVVNRFGADIGFFDSQTSYLMEVTRARGWTLHGLLSMVGLTDYVEGCPEAAGYYWAEVAIFAFAPRYNEFSEAFGAALSKKLADGVRPDIDLKSSSIDTLLREQGKWTPSNKLPAPTKTKGTVIVKRSMKPSEAAIEAGRNKNIGCYIVSYAFIAAVLVGIVLLVKFLLGL